MVEVIKEKCSVTGKVIVGVGLDDFQEKWKSHLTTIKCNEAPKKEEPKKEAKPNNVFNIESKTAKVFTEKKASKKKKKK